MSKSNTGGILAGFPGFVSLLLQICFCKVSVRTVKDWDGCKPCPCPGSHEIREEICKVPTLPLDS